MCNIHQVPLSEKCPNCSQNFLPLPKKARIGFCSRCKCWLGENSDKISQVSVQFSVEEVEWYLFVSKEIANLISFMSKTETGSFTNSTAETIILCVEKATNREISKFARLIKTHIVTFCGWYRGKVKPYLKDILKICYCLNITLLDFLTQPELITTKEIKVRNWIDIDKKTPRATPKIFEPRQIEIKLKKYLNDCPPLSLNQVGLKIGYDKKFLNQKFPDICKEIKANFSKHQRLIWDTKRNELEREIKIAVCELERREEFVSGKRVAKFLNKPKYEGRRDVTQIIFNIRRIGKPS